MIIKDILVINPGSTSTKIAVYTDEAKTVAFETNIVHDEDTINSFPNIGAQKQYRTEMVLDYLRSNHYNMEDLSAVVGRGGMVYELEGGGYQVNEKLCQRMASDNIPPHASSLGAMIAYEIATPLGLPAYIYDSTMGCELLDICKVTGIAGLERYGAIHLLNSRAQAIKYFQTKGENYQDKQFIVCHMGGGITANAWKDGKVIDVSSYDDGPMAPERSGGVPLLLFKKLCFDGKHTEADIDKLISGRGGLFSYLGTKDCRQVEKMIEEGDSNAATVYEGMALQIAKAIAGLTCTLKGQVDVIILTGGIAHSKKLTSMIRQFSEHLGPIEVMAGESELEALAAGAVRMLKGEEEAKIY
ncbi:MAG: butyrate kinase [Firmicutes bacterium]|nr:butyrate kinase [Bacillota bacterium]